MSNVPPYAVVFKTHFWDAFAARQLQRLHRHAGTENLFVLVDETRQPVPDIGHDHVIRMTEQTSEQEGFLVYPKGRLFWYNTDYQLYHFIEKFPQFAYIVTVEYDCVVNMDISHMVEAMAVRGLDFVGQPVRSPASFWHWQNFLRPYYPELPDITGQLLCFAVFRRTFALQLKASRLEHTRRYLNHEILPLNQGESPPWPNNEGFVGAEITRLGVVHAKLNEFCDTSYYNWAPAFPEPILASIPPNTIVHPLLDMPRFIKSISTKHKWDIESLLDATTRLGKIGLQCDPKTLIPGLLCYFVKTGNLTALESLRQYATERDAHARALFNVARGKPATQSSTCDYSIFDTTSQDAAGAVNGVVTGKFGFHTDADPFPWWCVDLELSYPVREILIHNRLDLPGRAHSLMVACSNDMLSWRTLYEHTGKPPFGGADGEPLRIEFKIPVEIRFLRLQLQHQEVLHLDEVEIFV